jgi:20S proteasome subunit alpha 5
MDPSGTYVRFKARAIGSASEGAQSQLQEKYNASMTLTEATDLAMQVLKQFNYLC